jgi:hypothetical protein
MDMNLIIGIFAVIFGITTLIVRQIAPHKFTKLNAIQERFGKKVGYIIHFSAYTIMPLVFGFITIKNSL